MATAEDIIRIAEGEVGYYAPDDPEPGSKYGRWMAELTGEEWLAGPSTVVWWCDIGASWVFAQAGMACPGFPSYNVPNTIADAKAAGIVLDDKTQAQRGDVVTYDWGGDGSGDHIGFVRYNQGSYLDTVEFNTSGTDWGSQGAGNGVHNRTRAWGTVLAIIRPPYDTPAATDDTTTTETDTSNSIEPDGWWGTQTTTALQRIHGTTQDGIVSGQVTANNQYVPRAGSGWDWGAGTGSQLVTAMQTRVGATADGLWGHDTSVAWQGFLGVTQDGYFGADSVSTLQTWINQQ
jgi:hypothetical protein